MRIRYICENAFECYHKKEDECMHVERLKQSSYIVSCPYLRKLKII